MNRVLTRLILASLTLGGSEGVNAQQDPGNFCPPYVTLDNARARWAFPEIFAAFGTTLIVDPDVSGTVSFWGYPQRDFESFIIKLLKQCLCTYRVSGSVYTICKRPDMTGDFSWPPYDNFAWSVDDRFIYHVEGTVLSKLDLRSGAQNCRRQLAITLPSASFNLAKEPDRARFIQYARTAGFELTIAPEMKERVSFQAGPPTLNHLNNQLAKSLKAIPTKLTGESLFLRKVKGQTYLNLFRFDSADNGGTIKPTISIRSFHILISTTGWTYKCRKSDLSIVSWTKRV